MTEMVKEDYAEIRKSRRWLMFHRIASGKSDWWRGSLEELSQIRNILSKFNIFYVDDFIGEWAYRKR